MKIRGLHSAILLVLLFAGMTKSTAQVDSVKYLLKYDTALCRFDAHIVITKGQALLSQSPAFRAQFNAQLSIIMPEYSDLTIVQNHMPKQGNSAGNNSGPPLIWTKSTKVSDPAAMPGYDFQSIVPTLSPTSYYNELLLGDTVKLFSFVIDSLELSPDPCATGVRFFINGVDPASDAPGMGGGDFSNGFTIGGLQQDYQANLPRILPPVPVLSTATDCSAGLEVNLTVGTSSCQQPVTYSWTGPNGYSSTTQNVSIIPSTAINNGTYFVTVTDKLGCVSSTSTQAFSKPNAGPDQSTCRGGSVQLNGTEPISGTWSADPSNPAGATLVPGAGGTANVNFSSMAVGTYLFIYDFMGCIDTAAVEVISPNAGPDPSPITCYQNGTATVTAADGPGTWSVGAGSAGTATITDPNALVTTVTDFSAFGNYFLVWTMGSCTDTVTIITNDNCDCIITNNSLTPVSPSTYCGSSGNILINGGNASPGGGTYLWQYRLNGGSFADAPSTNDAEDYTTLSLSAGVHSFRRLYFVTDNGLPCEDTSNVVTFTVFATPAAPSNLTAVPNPLCIGQTVNLSVSPNAGATFTWSVSPSSGAGLTLSTTNTTTMTPSAPNLYTVSVIQTVNGCPSAPSTVAVTANPTPPTPIQANLVGTNPTTCGGSDGSIQINGLKAGDTYTLDYTKNGTPLSASITANGSGSATLGGLTAGNYSNMKLTNASGCQSGTFTGTITLSDPNPPPAPSGINANPSPSCLGTVVTISVTNNPGATYNWSASSPNAGLGSSTTNTITMNPLAAGTYTIIVTQTVAGCTSPPSSVGVSVNNTPPTPTSLTVTGTNPSVCGGSDGNIRISGLNNLQSYKVNYSINGVPTTDTISSNTSGVVTIPGLSQGTYTDFSIGNFANCTSGVYPGPVSLSDPAAPAAPSTPTAVPNPVCLGQTVALATNGQAGATYNWSASSPNAGLGSSTTKNNTMNPTAAGTYLISVSQTVAGCTSPSSSVSVTVNNAPPNLDPANFSVTNPTVCGGTDGSISISGLPAGLNITLNYTKNGSPVSVNLTVNGSGVLVLGNLTAGNYANFQLSNGANCNSNTVSGPYNLSDPSSPPAPTGLIANPNPACLGETVNLSVNNNPGATYTWSASPVGNGLVASTTNTTTMVPSSVGFYTVSVFQTVAGCTSPTANLQVEIKPQGPPPNPANISSTNPTVCGGTDGTITIGGYTANFNHTITYEYQGSTETVMVLSDGSGNIVITGLASGSYTNFSVTGVNGCASPPYAGPVNLSDPGAPPPPSGLTAVPNPACIGDQIALSVTNNPSAVYTWSANSPNAGLVASSTNTTTMTPSMIGTYTISVIQTVAGCTSPPAVLDVTVSDIPPTPDVDDVSTSNPVTCGVDNGLISFDGFVPSATYTVDYEKDGSPVSVMITADGSGTITLTNLGIGTYTNFVFTNSSGCSSSPYAGPVVLTGPAPPPAPSGLNGVPNPICLGGTVALSVTNNPNAAYTWSASSPDAGLVNSITNTTSMTPTASGVYTISVYQTVNGCNSPAASIPITVNDNPPTPGPGNVSSTNPTACSADDGTITIDGYINGASYTLDYTFNGNPVSVPLVANGQGELVLQNLGPGSYANFQITNDSQCSSGTFAGPIVLVEPDIPDAPENLQAVPNPVCLGSSVALSVDNNPGAVYTWSASGPGAGLVSSTSNTTTMTPVNAGLYTISVYQTVAGCTSPTTSVDVFVRATCYNPDFGVTYTGIPIMGDLATNDKEQPGTTYSNPQPVGSNPDACMPVIAPDGQYMFTCNTPGEYSYRVDVCLPNQGPCEKVALEITVLDINEAEHPPLANHDYIATNGNEAIMITILANDKCESIPNCTLGAPTMITPPVGGSFNVGTRMYTPNNGFTGRDSFQYEVCQNPTTSPVSCDREWVYIRVYPPQSNEFTNAMDDYGQTPLNTVLNVGASSGLLANDKDPKGLAQTVGAQNATVPGKGSVVINPNGSYVFTPFTDYVGPVDFPYETCRVGAPTLCDSATLHILVAPQEATGSIGDYVWLDKNGDGIQNNNENGIPGIIVKLYNANDVFIKGTITDNSGHYIFEDVLAGDYYVQFMMTSAYLPTLAGVGSPNLDNNVDNSNGNNTTATFTLVAGDTNLTIDAGFYECVKIGELVWYDINKNDVKDPFENGINGIKVNLWRKVGNSWVLWDTQLTGHKPGTPSDDGYYMFCTLPGTYYVQFIMPPLGLVLVRPFIGGNPFLDSDVNHANGTGTTPSFTLTSGQSKLDIAAGYYPMARAGNIVWMDDNNNGLQDANESKVANVLVQAYDANTLEMVGEDMTDNQGIYEIDYLDKRDIFLKFNPPAGYSATIARSGNDDTMDSDVDHSYGENTTRMFSLEPGENYFNIDLGLAAGILPVEWLGIEVNARNQSHEVVWQTAAEINVQEYIVERKLANQVDFEPISTETIRGQSQAHNEYRFFDYDVERAGTYYYRVKQLDFDGKSSYSREVAIAKHTDHEVKMYPNPADSYLDFEYQVEEGETFSLRMYNAEGIEVKRFEQQYENEKSTFTRINIEGLAPGIYRAWIRIGHREFIKNVIVID